MASGTKKQQAKVARDYRANNKKEINARFTEARRRVKRIVFDAYGGCKCIGCGETEELVLTMDHIDQRGTNHRMANGKRYGGHHLYRWLIANDFPPGFRVLCFNCQIRAFYGRR